MYDFVVEDGYELVCIASDDPTGQQEITLDFFLPIELTLTKSSKVKCEDKAVLFQLDINATTSASSLQTTTITGNNVCVSIIGSLTAKSTKDKVENQSVCLSDASFTDTLTAHWVNSSSSTQGDVTLTTWFKKAGQSKVKGV